MAVVVTYSDNTFVVTGGTEGTPATMEDVYTYAYDNSLYVGGEEVVESPKVGQYTVRASIEFGDTSTPTYFASEREQVRLIKFAIRNSATLRLGKKVGDYATNGSWWGCSSTGTYQVVISTGQSTATLLLYDSRLTNDTNSNGLFQDGTVDIIKSKLSAYYFDTEHWTRRWDFVGNVDVSFDTVDITDVQILTLVLTPSKLRNVHMHKVSYGFVARLTVTLDSPQVTEYQYSDYWVSGSAAADTILYVKNPVGGVVTPGNGIATGAVVEQYPFNLYIKDKDGVNLASVTCLLEDKDGNEIFSVSTAGDGTITEQIVDYKKWEGTDETLTEYSPHKLTPTKANYEPIIIPNITMDEDKDLEYRLLPALAVGDVRLSTDFGEDKEGTLDLPAVGKVQKLIKFDNETKIGTRKDAIESTVKEGEQYGEDGTELTGTYVRNVIGGAIVVGQDTVGTVVGQATAGIVVGE